MAVTASKDQNAGVQLGWQAADFRLKGTDGKFYTSSDARGPKGLVVAFICNHCPYVQGALPRIIKDLRDLKPLGIGSIAIMPNDTLTYPDDSFENMQKMAAMRQLPFPYVIDETQNVARVYDAQCTPEFYGFDVDLKLAYHGRLDSGRMNTLPADGKRDLFDAMKFVAETGKAPSNQNSSIGCSIKWKK